MKVAGGVGVCGSSSRDRRFADSAWTQNPLLRRVVQAAGTTVEGLVRDVPMDWKDAEWITFAASNLVAAAAPSNNPLLSPVAWKAVIDSGGGSIVTGTR
jgi:polyhydroxyalkanoate synthase subunit PhaC